jgi:RHS repeat-associated protein
MGIATGVFAESGRASLWVRVAAAVALSGAGLVSAAGPAAAALHREVTGATRSGSALTAPLRKAQPLHPLTLERRRDASSSDRSPNPAASGPASPENVLIFGLGDEGDTEPITNLEALLQSDGYNVTVDKKASLPSSIASYGSIWWVDASDVISSSNASKLESFVKAGGGLYLTGERPCCEANNQEDQFIIDNLVTGGGVGVGGQGDANDPSQAENVNRSVEDGVGIFLSTWTPSAPGGMTGVAPQSVFTSTQFSSGTLATGAVWDGSQLSGGSGRLAILMDVNWLESEYWDAATVPGIVESLATFLTKGSPPSASESGSAFGTGAASRNYQSCSQGLFPVDCASGDFWHSFTDVSVPGRGPALDLTRTYNALSAASEGIFGFGWSSSYDWKLTVNSDDSVTITENDGSQVTAEPDGSGTYTLPGWADSSLTETNGVYSFVRQQTMTYTFDAAGQLTAITDLNGYSTTLTYNPAGQLISVSDPAGRSLIFTYGTNELVSSVSDPMGRSYTYNYDSAGDLTSVLDPLGRTTTFTYDDSHQMLTMTDPQGGTVTNVYDSEGRISSQTDPMGLVTIYSYSGDNFSLTGGTTTITDPHGNVEIQTYVNGLLLSLSKLVGGPAAGGPNARRGSSPAVSALKVTTSNLPAARQYKVYSATVKASGGVQPYAWSIISGAVPTGLSLNLSTGVISGSPTGSGTSSFTVQATDSSSPSPESATASLSITVAPTALLAVTTTSLTGATQGVNYSQAVKASGGITPYSWSILSGALPAGLSLDPSTGTITGAPTASGTLNFTVQVTDSSTPTAQTATQALSIAVAASALTITTAKLPAAQQYKVYSATVKASGGVKPYAWSVAAGALPAGLTLNPSTGAITGSPTGSGTSSFTVQVADTSTPSSQTATAALSIGVAATPPLAVTTTSLAAATQGVSYSQTLSASGGVTPYSWSIVSGALPGGLNLSSTGAITGTPTGSGTSDFTVQVIDSSSPAVETATQALSITATASPLAVTTKSVHSATQGSSYSATVKASGGVKPYAWSIASGALPPGLSLHPSTGVLSGIPTGSGTSTFTVQVTDGSTPTAQSATEALSMTVSASPPAIATASLPGGTWGEPFSTTLQATGGVRPYAWSIVSGTLPAGLSLDPSSGDITGTPSFTGTFLFTVQVTDQSTPSPQTGTQALSITISPEELTWTYSYDPVTLGQTSVTDPEGNVTLHTYDGDGNLLSTTTPLGEQTTYTYNDLNEVLTTTTPLEETTTNTYDAGGNLLTTTDPLGNETTYTYGDSAHPGDLTSTTDPVGRVITYTYDTYGDLASEATSPESGVTDTSTYVYDTDGELNCSTSPDGTATGTTCPPGGSPYVTGSTAYTYDADGELLTTTDPQGAVASKTYDGDGNVVTVTDPTGNQTTTTYDYDNRPISETAGANGPDPSTTTYEYDVVPGSSSTCAAGAVGATYCETTTDPNGQTTSNYYDARDELVQQTRPGGQTTTYTYDADGNLTTTTDPDGRMTTDGYDADGHLESITYSDSTPDVADTYDADGHRIEMQDGTGTTSYSYDADGRLTSTTNGAGATVDYGYNAADDLTTITYPNGETVTRSYDGADQLASVTDWNSHTTTFTYDPDGNIIATQYPNGDTVSSTYDLSDRMIATDVAPTGSPSSPLASVTYQRDAAGLITQETDAGALSESQSYAYDAEQRLTGAGASSYTYDSAGNPVSLAGTAQTFSTSDEVTAAGPTTYSYDTGGNRLSATTPSQPQVDYSYDAAERLTSITRVSNSSQTIVATYTYDGDGLRASKRVGSTTTRFTWDTQSSTPELLVSGLTDFIYGPDGLPIEQIKASTVGYYVHDALGSTRVLLSSTGSSTETLTYGAYGAPISVTGTQSTPLTFAGAYLDSESGLYYLINRYYDPTTAQFLSVDPALSYTGQPYTYANDDPANATDPSGQLSVTVCFGLCLGYTSQYKGFSHLIVGSQLGVSVSIARNNGESVSGSIGSPSITDSYGEPATFSVPDGAFQWEPGEGLSNPQLCPSVPIGPVDVGGCTPSLNSQQSSPRATQSYGACFPMGSNFLNSPQQGAEENDLR